MTQVKVLSVLQSTEVAPLKEPGGSGGGESEPHGTEVWKGEAKGRPVCPGKESLEKR